MQQNYIMAIDQGTSGTKTVIFDTQARIVAKATQPLQSYYPQPGFVEQDPLDIYQNVLNSIKKCLQNFSDKASGRPEEIVACGISNQRETFVLWDDAGRHLCSAPVWQCKRSIEICNRLKGSGIESEIKARTGLIIDPYFPGTKLVWLYENNRQIKNAIDTGKVYFGTVDTWLLFKLTGGRSYGTDYTNASRTLFFNINELEWDSYLLEQFHLENLRLPPVRPSSYTYGQSNFEGLLPREIPISAMIGDSHAAAFGEGCFSEGTAKATIGTGSSILLNIGKKKVDSQNGMVTTICWSIADRVDYAMEGIIVTCGATIKWLGDQCGFFGSNSDAQSMAKAVPDNQGVYFIPAFSGLGSPHWKMDIKAAITGLTLGCNKNHIVRAALESIPYQIKDVISAMEKDSGIPLKELKVDGGLTANHFVMQLLADLLNIDVVNIGIEEVSALGAAYMAALQQGIFDDISQLKSLKVSRSIFTPGPGREKAEISYEGWKQAIQQML